MQNAMVRFIDCYVPTETCNLKCPYCYISQNREFSKRIKSIGHTPEEVKSALSRKRFGGIIFANFCAGGETLLGEDILKIVYAVLEEGHFAQIVTNGTINKRFEEIAEWPSYILDRLFIKFSFHYTELKRLNKVNDFFDNIIRVRNAGCSISLEITPGDEMLPYIDEMKEISLERLGALPHVTVARNENTAGYEILTKLDKESYKEIWGGNFKSPMFEMKMQLLSEKRKEYCYGGEWTFALDLGTGNLRQCYRGSIIDNIYEEVERPIHFKPIGCMCPEQYCFNGHAWLTLGAIPELDTINYAEIRDRICKDGSHWLSTTMRDFFSHKLKEQHVIYREVDEMPKVLLLGDSICEGYRENVKENLLDKARVYYMNDNARFSTYLLRYIHEWADSMQIGSNIDVVHFNVGLWDILRLDGDNPLVDLDSYRSNLQRIINKIRYIFSNARIIFATTTPIKEELANYSFLRLNYDIADYNSVALEVMNKNDVMVNDLYTYALEDLQNYYEDWTHFNKAGFEKLAYKVTDYVKQVLGMSGET